MTSTSPSASYSSSSDELPPHVSAPDTVRDARPEEASLGTRTRSFRFLHTSDWQLGMPAHFLGEESRIRFAEARLNGVERIFSVASEQGCQAIVVAGDVFDDNLLQPEVYRRAMDVLGHAPVPVFLLPGNHDPLDAASIYNNPDFEALGAATGDGAPVIVLRDTHPVRVSEELGDSVRIIGAPLKSKRASTDLVAHAVAETEQNYGSAEAGEIRILVGHGAVATFGDDFNLSAIDVGRATQACDQRIVDYIALGDTHSTTRLNEAGTVWYSGAHEVTAYREPNGGGETHSGYALVVDITVDEEAASHPATVDVAEHRTGQWTFVAMDADVNSRADAEAFVERLRAVENKRHTAIKYALRGTVDLTTSGWLEDTIGGLAPGFAALYERRRCMDLHVAPDMDELSSMHVGGGYMQHAAEELAERATNKDTEAGDALRLLFRLNANVGKGL
ncbi:metallophosphoesterase family protein [Corynebacterium anserum]|uniref:Uncharacterized protein n=1 Tax=Corynebacterium anserum TaxID=2684406 RepID=A0A7G7YP74_9CORY|nr:metallophosphoesterase [Corynebacterium anserum]MBC2681899.1 hypothetical protein [Corynebacterium anserum]QNH96294.1 hypothetical protein GP473_06120 [Corynebacterium anserum]